MAATTILRTLAVILLFNATWPVEAASESPATVQAVSCSQAHVQTAIDSARDGDLVTVPPGSCTWTGLVTVTRGVTLQGAGIDKTIIAHDHADVGLAVPSVHGKFYRVTGFTFVDGPTSKKLAALIRITGNSKTVRIDHNKFDFTHKSEPNVRSVRIFGFVWGVIDHNQFISGGNLRGAIDINHPTWNDTGNYGDAAWADVSHWGTEKFVFIEDNTFTGPTGGHMSATDASHGARFVVRHNTMTNASFGTHGTESGDRARGARAVEIYNNTATHSPYYATFFRLRAGTALIHGNAVNGYNTFAALNNNRSTSNFKTWKSCDGTFAFDVNDGRVYDSGTHTGPAGAFDLTDSTKNWATDVWSKGGFSVRNVTKGNGGYARANSVNTVQVMPPLNGAPRFDPGDQYQILRATICMDAPGSGGGSLLAGYDPSPKAWPNQSRDPVYAWNNVHNAGKGDAAVRSHYANPHIVEGRDFFNGIPKPGYTPFVYPHPLVSNGAPTPLSPPSDLRVR
jgi:hypothetical protein